MATDVELRPTKLADGQPSSFIQWVVTKNLSDDGSICVLPIVEADIQGHFKPLPQGFTLSHDEAVKIAIHLLQLTNDEAGE